MCKVVIEECERVHQQDNIERRKVVKTIKNQKSGKASGIVGITVEML